MKHNGRGLRINPDKKVGPSQRKVLKAMLGSSRSNQTSIAETKRASRLLQDHRPVFTFGAQSEFIRKKKSSSGFLNYTETSKCLFVFDFR